MFGGGGSEISHVSTLTREQRQLLDQLTGLLGGQLGTGVTPYQGQRVPGLTGMQQQGLGLFGGMGGMAQSAQGITQSALGQFNPALGGQYQAMATPALQSSLANWDPASAQDYWQKAFVQPGMRNWTENVAPMIQERFAGQNAADSGLLTRELARSGQSLTTDLNAQLADIMYSGEQAQRNRQLSAIPQAQGLGMMGTDILNAILGGAGQMPGMIGQQMLGAGEMERGVQGQQMAAEQAKWLESQGYQNPWLNLLPTALGTSAFENVIQQQGPGLFASMMPGIGQALGSAGGLQGIGSALGSIGGAASGAGSAAMSVLSTIASMI